jgi:hypothetical protein
MKYIGKIILPKMIKVNVSDQSLRIIQQHIHRKPYHLFLLSLQRGQNYIILHKQLPSANYRQFSLVMSIWL